MLDIWVLLYYIVYMGNKRVTLNKINEAVRASGHNEQLVKGNGYYYWINGEAYKFREMGVYGVSHLNELTIEQWIADLETRRIEFHRYE